MPDERGVHCLVCLIRVHTEEEVFESSLAAILKYQVDVVVIGLCLKYLDEERVLTMLVELQ